MKVKLIILLLVISRILNATQADSLYISAGKAYTEGNYEEALTLYKSILDHGLESTELYYNMGNTAFRSNKLGYSVLYYEKALKLDPSNTDARNNLSFVSMYMEDELEQVPEFFLKTWFKSLFRLFSVTAWSFMSLALFLLLLAGVIAYIFPRKISVKKAGFFTAVFAFVIFILSITAASERNRELTKPGSGIILEPSIVVKSTPSQSGTDLFILHEGTRIDLEDEVGEWIEVRISDGRVGWIPSSAQGAV